MLYCNLGGLWEAEIGSRRGVLHPSALIVKIKNGTCWNRRDDIYQRGVHSHADIESECRVLCAGIRVHRYLFFINVIQCLIDECVAIFRTQTQKETMIRGFLLQVDNDVIDGRGAKDWHGKFAPLVVWDNCQGCE